MMKLNLGAGTVRVSNFTSVDLFADADIVADIGKKLPFDDESVDAIYTSHAIEHLSFREYETFKREVDRVLKPGATLEIRCPNIALVCKKFVDDPLNPFTMNELYGLQHEPGEFHRSGHTIQSVLNDFDKYEPQILEPSMDTELHIKFTKGEA